jgi:RimJ/RimL family protein N-acetyltransferase
MLTDYVFDNTPAHRLDFATWSGNWGMCRVGDKLGWTRESVFREARVVRGQRYDSVTYGVLRSEWLRRGPTVS